MMMASVGILASLVTICGFAVIYHHALFPAYLRWRAKHVVSRCPAPSTRELPSVIVIVPAYNEATVIAGKLRNLTSLIYPADKVEVIIACDGCTDDTAPRARRAAAELESMDVSITVVEHQVNRGKVAVLNDALCNVKSDVVCLTDASSWMSVDALLQAERHFRQAEVGVVAGTYHLYRTGSVGEDAYWRYQRNVKEGEAAMGAPLGVHGACYFMRREAICRLPDDTINDDFFLPMHAVANGYRAVYEPSIMALEMEPTDQDMDFKRRCRIAAGNAQQVIRLATLLHPRHRGIAVAFASGKVLRVIMPYLMLACLIGSAILASESILFLVLLLLQAGGYAAAATFRLVGSRFRLLDILHYFVTGHAANLVGSVRYFAGLEKGRWTKVSSQSNLEVTP